MSRRQGRAEAGAPAPLIDAYLQDLRRALQELPAQEADEIVQSVREHIDAALDDLGRSPTTADVELVLRDLGPVEQIAHDATGNHTPSPGATDPTEQAGPHDVGGWALIGLAALSLPFVVVPFVAIPLALVVLVAAATGLRGRPGSSRRRRRVAIMLSALALALSAALIVFIFPATTDVAPQPTEPTPVPTDPAP